MLNCLSLKKKKKSKLQQVYIYSRDCSCVPFMGEEGKIHLDNFKKSLIYSYIPIYPVSFLFHLVS